MFSSRYGTHQSKADCLFKKKRGDVFKAKFESPAQNYSRTMEHEDDVENMDRRLAMMDGTTTSEPIAAQMETDVVQETKVKISFGVKRKEEPKLVNAPAAVTAVAVDSDEEREDEERQTKRRKMTHFEDGDNGADTRSNKPIVVIPMVIENDWRVTKLLEMQKEGTLSEADQARLALLTEDNPFTPTTAPQDGAIVVGEADEEKNVEDANYDSVRIEDFGLAMLRGCGWKDGDGIGKNPQKVPLRLLQRRPNGLGLGATPAAPKDKSKKATTKDGEELETEVKPGSFVKITTGRLAGKYAKVESRDDDINSIYARLALGNNAVKVLLSVVEIVSKKEYEREGKCINKAEYDKEKEKYEKRNETYMDERVKEVKDRPLKSKNGKYEIRDEGAKHLWARPGLIVRFVDDSYKGGRLYKCKLRVIDVASRKDISLEDPQSGKVYYNLRQSDMETVIPRSEGEKVMIVRGTHSGSVAVMEEKDRDNYKLIARILHSNQVLKIHFDDVCQYLPKNDDDYDD